MALEQCCTVGHLIGVFCGSLGTSYRETWSQSSCSSSQYKCIDNAIMPLCEKGREVHQEYHCCVPNHPHNLVKSQSLLQVYLVLLWSSVPWLIAVSGQAFVNFFLFACRETNFSELFWYPSSILWLMFILWLTFSLCADMSFTAGLRVRNFWDIRNGRSALHCLHQCGELYLTSCNNCFLSRHDTRFIRKSL